MFTLKSALFLEPFTKYVSLEPFGFVVRESITFRSSGYCAYPQTSNYDSELKKICSAFLTFINEIIGKDARHRSR